MVKYSCWQDTQENQTPEKERSSSPQLERSILASPITESREEISNDSTLKAENMKPQINCRKCSELLSPPTKGTENIHEEDKISGGLED